MAPETLALGDYELVSISKGGQAWIYRATHRSSGRVVVAKLAPSSDTARATALVREREALLRLEHPGIVKALDWIEEQGYLGLVLEHVEGLDLEQVMRHGDVPRTEERVRGWALQLARILDYLHAQRPAVIYRDLKPSNVILRPDGQLVLIDFGAIRVKTPDRLDTVPLGTPGYAAPEQYGQASSDERSDVYSLGVTLFELMSGREPEGFRFDFPPLPALGVEVSETFASVIARSVHAEPARRFPSARAFIEALESPAPRVEPARGWVAACAAAGLALLMQVSVAQGFEGLPYLGGLAAFGLGAGLALRQRQPSAAPTAGFASTFAGLTLGLWAVLPLLVSTADLQALLRRASLEGGFVEVPVEGPLLAWALLALFCVLWGHLFGSALGRRAISLSVVGGGGFLALAFASLLGRAWEHDAAKVTAIEWNAQWSVASSVKGVADFTRIEDRSTGWRGVLVRSEQGDFAVHDMRDGRAMWQAHADRRLLVEPCGDVVLSAQGPNLEARVPKTGEVRFSQKLPAAIRTMHKGPRQVMLALADGQVVSLDPVAMRLGWSWKAQTGRLELGVSDAEVVVVELDRARLTILEAATGEVRCSRALPQDLGGRLNQVGASWLWCRADGIDCLDARTGELHALVQRADLDASTIGSAPFAVRRLDGERLVALSGRWLVGLSLQPPHILYKVRLPRERFALHECGAGRLYLDSDAGRLLGLQPLRGTVIWESWVHPGPSARPAQLATANGEPDAWSLLESMPYGVCFEERGASRVSCLDASSGRVRWRLAGLANAREWMDDETRVLVLQEGPSETPRIVSIETPRDEEALRGRRTSPR